MPARANVAADVVGGALLREKKRPEGSGWDGSKALWHKELQQYTLTVLDRLRRLDTLKLSNLRAHPDSRPKTDSGRARSRD